MWETNSVLEPGAQWYIKKGTLHSWHSSRRGPRTDPCGTPLSNNFQTITHFFSDTLWVVFFPLTLHNPQPFFCYLIFFSFFQLLPFGFCSSGSSIAPYPLCPLLSHQPSVCPPSPHPSAVILPSSWLIHREDLSMSMNDYSNSFGLLLKCY